MPQGLGVRVEGSVRFSLPKRVPLNDLGFRGYLSCRRCRRPRKGAAAAQGQIERSFREYCNTLDFCQVGSKARGSSPFHNLFEAGWCLGHQMIKEVAWRGKGLGGVQGLRFRGVGGRGRARLGASLLSLF